MIAVCWRGSGNGSAMLPSRTLLHGVVRTNHTFLRSAGALDSRFRRSEVARTHRPRLARSRLRGFVEFLRNAASDRELFVASNKLRWPHSISNDLNIGLTVVTSDARAKIMDFRGYPHRVRCGEAHAGRHLRVASIVRTSMRLSLQRALAMVPLALSDRGGALGFVALQHLAPFPGSSIWSF